VALQIRVRVDNGIAKMWNRRQISASSYCDQSHYLHPHPYSMQLPIWTALPNLSARSLTHTFVATDTRVPYTCVTPRLSRQLSPPRRLRGCARESGRAQRQP
jgi:hypothetical protein